MSNERLYGGPWTPPEEGDADFWLRGRGASSLDTDPIEDEQDEADTAGDTTELDLVEIQSTED